MSKTIMKIFVVLILLLPNIAFAVEIPKAELVLVKKSERKMYLIKNNKPFRAGTPIIIKP